MDQQLWNQAGTAALVAVIIAVVALIVAVWRAPSGRRPAPPSGHPDGERCPADALLGRERARADDALDQVSHLVDVGNERQQIMDEQAREIAKLRAHVDVLERIAARPWWWHLAGDMRRCLADALELLRHLGGATQAAPPRLVGRVTEVRATPDGGLTIVGEFDPTLCDQPLPEWEQDLLDRSTDVIVAEASDAILRYVPDDDEDELTDLADAVRDDPDEVDADRYRWGANLPCPRPVLRPADADPEPVDGPPRSRARDV